MAVGGYAFLLIALLPSLHILDIERRELLLRAVFERFRWVIWAVILALLTSGLYNSRLAWEAPWGTYWKLLTLKIVLSFAFFAIRSPMARAPATLPPLAGPAAENAFELLATVVITLFGVCESSMRDA